MSEERTRFPIQPKERRRSAKSSGDIAVPGEDYMGEKAPDQDKPSVPPHRRHEEDQDKPEDRKN